MKRVVSYALWGENPLYWNGLEAMVKAHQLVYPGWELRIHHDSSIDRNPKGKVLKRLADEGLVSLRYAEENKALCRSMLWRILPIWDKTVEVVLCRDIDSLVTGNDRWAVEEWLKSEAIVHGINDNPAHSIPLMGGMVGFKCTPVREALGCEEWEDLIHQRPAKGYQHHGADQILLNSYVWEKTANRAMIHSIGGHTPYPLCEMKKTVEKAFIEGVDRGVLEGTTKLVPYLGVAGYNTERAIAYCDTHLPDTTKERVARAMKQPPSRINTYKAVIATDWSASYAFYLPLTAKWWVRTGYAPLVLVVGDREAWEKDELRGWILEKTKEQGGEVHFIPEMEGHRSSTIAQVARVFAAGLPVSEQDYLLTSDADMWPLAMAWFHKQDTTKELNIWYANAYSVEDGVQKYPICYTGARASVWREIMKVEEGKLAEKLQWQLDAGLGRGAGSTPAWNYDEKLMSLRISEWPGSKNGMMQLMTRGQKDGRVDRSGWKVENLGEKVDAHLPRFGHEFEGWYKMRDLLKEYWGEADLAWADEYFEGFKNRYKPGQ